MDKIEELIPYRKPFLLVDELISAENNEIVGIKTFDDSFEILNGTFHDSRIVPGVILVEAMAQCGGAGLKTMGLIDEGLYGLTSIESARFTTPVKSGDTVKMVIRNERFTPKAVKQTGTAYVDNQVVAEASWLCVKMNND